MGRNAGQILRNILRFSFVILFYKCVAVKKLLLISGDFLTSEHGVSSVRVVVSIGACRSAVSICFSVLR